ncbi:MAG TPA: hypothetical protein VKZ53_23980 [Candidatus Angelobacter sp.]|nr:hypothetical protein [Candidatus Angelobacter sp.]
MSQTTKQDVESAVRTYWSVTAAKDAEKQQEAYSEEAFIFTSSSRRLELARLVSMRRQREYLAATTKLRVEVGSPIEVALLGSNSAIAAYTLHFHTEQMPTNGSITKSQEEHLKNARVTHVFQCDAEGRLRIIHEHISMPQG